MKAILMTCLFACSTLLSYAGGDDILGVWYNTEKTGKVEIYKCGDLYCGKIVWLKEPNEADGSPKVDSENPEPAKRSTKLIGLKVLWGFESKGNGKYKGGEIYDPENGKTYSCKMTLEDNNNLDVRGYIGVPTLGRTENWTRAN